MRIRLLTNVGLARVLVRETVIPDYTVDPEVVILPGEPPRVFTRTSSGHLAGGTWTEYVECLAHLVTPEELANARTVPEK